MKTAVERALVSSGELRLSIIAGGLEAGSRAPEKAELSDCFIGSPGCSENVQQVLEL